MRRSLDKFYEFLDRPLFLSARLLLALLVIPLALSFTEPLWSIDMQAPQYPKGLSIDIYSYTLEGGRDGADLQEVNILNHYIGMRKLDRAELSDLDWIPFALGALGILALRVAAIGNVRALIDLLVATAYFSAFSMFRFVYKLYEYGHNLDPDAPMKVPGFTPAIFGTKQIANFTTSSLPSLGTIYIGIFATGVFALAIWHLWAGRRAFVRREGARSTS